MRHRQYTMLQCSYLWLYSSAHATVQQLSDPLEEKTVRTHQNYSKQRALDLKLPVRPTEKPNYKK